jgi:2-C-methyl-D-erythritol 2,4-cyclodiphosphate synthase
MRAGIGYDLHRLVEGRALILGGVTIPFDKGLLGHSDADVLVHAIIDALLGAACLGNIGMLYPDTDPLYAGANSLQLLSDVRNRISDAGYEIVNIDSVIVAQSPKLNPFISLMRDNVANILQILPDRVNVKPKTNEGLGPEGEGLAMSAQAVVLLSLPVGQREVD